MKKENKNSSLLSRWKKRADNGSAPTLIPKAPEDAVIPLSSGQQRIWFLQQLYPGNPFYNYSESFSFEGNLHTDYLKKALYHIFDKHDILRSYYPMVAGRAVLKISETVPEIKDFDFSHLSDLEAKHKIDLVMREQSNTIFDLARPGLLKLSLIKLSPERSTLFLTLHHIIVDEWSIGILKEQLASYYRQLCQGLDVNDMNPSLQYGDYAHWQRNQPIDTEQLDYWKRKLSDDIPMLNLQTDHTRPVKPSFRGKQYTQTLSPRLSSDILDMTRKMGATPFVFLLSVYHLMLYRYSGQKDILIGTPISNRSTKSLENLLGFFIDTVVLRNELEPLQSFSGFVKEVKKSTLEAFSNKAIPFDVLVKELGVARSLTVNPFFQVMFLYHSEATVPSFGKAVRLTEQTEFDTEVAKFDLTLSISERSGQLSLTFEYDTDFFEETTITRMSEHFQMLLKGIVSNPDATMMEIPILTPPEKEIFLGKPKVTENVFSKYQAIHHIIDEVSATHPHKTALTFEDTSITYESLQRKANVLAVHILTKTKKRNEIVGLCTDRSIDMIVGLIAILKAGCAYLPIDPNYPAQRLDFILSDAVCDRIVTQAPLAVMFDGFDKDIILVDSDETLGLQKKVVLPEVERDDLAYVIYTSGSTGQPKGVPVTHANIINSTAGRLTFYPKNPDAFLLMSSISFDSSKAGIFWTLCTGGNLVITPHRIEQDIDKIENSIREHSVTHTLMLPSLYNLVLEHGSVSKLGSLNTVMVAGEACPPSLCKLHFGKLSNVALYNEYGPTEATVWCMAHAVEKSDATHGVPIGRPVAEATIYLLDQNGLLVPYGAIGEIYVGGPGLTKGYMHRPELTEKSFVTDPFGENSENRLYKTGDLGRYRKDGAIEFLGRADDQVKIRGFRIELEEIENTMLADSGINEAVVMVKTPGDETDAFDVEDFTEPDKLIKLLKEHLSDSELNELVNAIAKLNSDQRNFLLQEMEVIS